jgi:hypothetical protein
MPDVTFGKRAMRLANGLALASALALAACTGPQNAPPNSAPPASSYAPAATLLPMQFQCPANGVSTQVQDFAQIVTVNYYGTTGDPTLCQFARNGVSQSNYYGQYPLGVSQGLGALRAGFASLFAGTATSFSADYRVDFLGGRQAYFNDTWTVLGVDTLNIGGQPVRTLVFRREQKGEVGNAFDGVERQWFDPASGVWVKRQVINTNGWGWGPDWFVTSISR